ncbi:retrovirus-related pol polyprotein from transposon TNT 1-94 [Tanacetum coccineum]
MTTVEVPQTLEYRGDQLNAAPVLEVENFTNWKKRNTNNVKDSKLASLFGKLKYDENLIDNIYETKKNKSLVSATPLSTAFFSSSIVQDFQDSPDNEEDTRSSHEYLNDLEEEYQARALLAKSKRFFKKGTQRFSSAKATDQTECHKCGKKGHFARDCWSKTSVSTYQSPFQPKPLSSPQHKPELRPTKDFEAKYNKVKAKLALLSSSALASKAFMVKNKCLITEAYEWDKEQVSSDDNEMAEVKVLMALAEENDDVSKEVARIGFILPNHDTGRILPAESQRNTTNPSVAVTDSSVTDYDSADESSVCSTPLPPMKKLDGAEPISGPKTIKSILRSKYTFKAEALKGVITNKPSSALAKGNKSSSASKVHSAPASKLKSVKIEDDPPLAIVIKELNDLKLQFSKNQSSHSRNNQPQQVLQNALQNKYKTQFKKSCELCSLNNHLSENCYKVLFCKKCERTEHGTCDHVEYISTMNMSQHLKSLGRASSRSKILRPSKRFFPPCTHCGCINHFSNEYLYYHICGLFGSYDHDINGHNRIISLEREINPRNPQHTFKRCEVCGSSTHATTDHYDIKWFKRGEALQTKKAEALKSTRAESSNANRSKTSTKRHMTGVKSYLHKYVEQSGPKVVFGDDSTCTTEGYGFIKCNGIFDEKRGTIFNSNKEVIMIAPRLRDVYVLDMTSSAQESCFFAKASKNLNWLWHKRLTHLNFKTINKLAKQNLVIGLSSLVYSKDKPCSSCEKGKHHRASFKIKDTFSIKKCLHLLHMDLFRRVTPRSINHEKYTLVIVNEYSRQSKRGISINQEKYAKDLLKKYDMNGSSVKTPMVPPNNLRPDLSGKSVNETQYKGMIGSLMYLKGTPSLGLWYPKCSGFDLKGYSDSDYAGCNMDRKSTSGDCQLLGGKLVYWSAKKQQSVAMSLAKAEYVAAARCCANILWMKSQLTEYDIIYEKVPIFCDNTSAIAISNNPVLHSRTKHIDIRYHFIRDHVLKGDIKLYFIPTQYQLADIFTKPMDEPSFKILIIELGMLNIDSKPEASALPKEN